MAGIMVSASTGAMNSLLGKLTTLMGEEFAKLKKLRKEVKFISDELSSMNDLLESLADVDELDRQNKAWRDQVREMSYDIEDIIDDFMDNIGDKNEKSGFVSQTIRRLKTLRARHQIAGQIEEIKTLVHEASERHKRYKLDGCIPTSSDVAIDKRIVALYANAADLVGMEGPTNELVNRLIDEEMQLKVVSIVGFGGLGKTTLANEVYHRLKGKFGCAAFVPVSQKLNIPKLLSSLLSQLGIGPSFHAFGLRDLLNKLREYLQDKRYFIIIDDLWDVSAWDVIKCAFPENNRGSRVIATTRIQHVAKTCCSPHHENILSMKPLGDKDSRTLFFRRIFGSEEACPHQLRDVSVEVLKKCGGLPLAIISIASLLASEGSKQKERWEHVRNSLGSMSGTNLTLDDMREILKLSYKNLPRHLKTCLLYLGMYPEDYTIRRSNLECQWIAEGFVNKAHGQDLEKVAKNYFNELVNRSLIQPVDFGYNGSVKSCKVHDMMLDLILSISAEENFISTVDDSQAITGLCHKIRRLSFCSDGANNGTILQGNISMSQVRSLAIFRSSRNIPLLSEFKFLRVLVAEFPEISLDDDARTIDLTGLCKLYQLRYLRIKGHPRLRCQLPKQIRRLQHLETLDLNSVSSIPSDIIHLPRLLHLRVPSGTRLPDDIGKMTSLRSLSLVDYMHNSLDSIKGLGELTNLSNLALTFGFYGDIPVDMVRRMDVLRSSLGKLCSLEYLYLEIYGCIDVLSTLSPPPRLLERLHIVFRGWFSIVPNWMGELRNLGELRVKVDELLKDGAGILAELPVLIDLNLCIRRGLREKIVIYGTAFPVLKRFSLSCSSVPYLTFQAGALPKLQRLTLQFNAHGGEKYGDAFAGLEYLSSLEEISAEIGCLGAPEPDKRSAESALRSAINMHPRHPRAKIKCDRGSSFVFDKFDTL